MENIFAIFRSWTERLGTGRDYRQSVEGIKFFKLIRYALISFRPIEYNFLSGTCQQNDFRKFQNNWQN